VIERPRYSVPDPLLEVDDLRVSFAAPEGNTSVVQGVSFTIERGRTLALVGDSGSGKTVTALALLRLVQPPGAITGGSILLRSARASAVDIARLKEGSSALYRIRGGLISMIFQEPTAALSPLHTIGSQVAEVMVAHHTAPPAAARLHARAMLEKVGLPASHYDRYPHQLSGGMRQRAMIAMALLGNPELLIADEPTTALDATLQAQILTLIKQLQREIGFAILLITHDFSVVARAADEVAVMSAGRIVEQGSAEAVFLQPRHPHTRSLLAAVPGWRQRQVHEWEVAHARSA
jgi:ABC-type dipeptide/oligopeptide/nickel transport system ATPase component